MIPKIALFVFFFVMLYALGVALFALLRSNRRSDDSAGSKSDRLARDKRMAKALTWRIGLALGVFALLILGFYAGWFHPHGLRVVA